MKKILTILLLLAMTLGLSGCGGFVSILPGAETAGPEDVPAQSGDEAGETEFRERSLLSFTDREEFGQTYYADTPVALSYQPEREDGSVGCRSFVFDRAAVIAACDALREMTVTGVSAEAPTSGARYVLTRSDGTEYDFTFGLLADGNTWVLNTTRGNYSITGGEALFDLTFPAYDLSYDVFDLYFSDSVRQFADGFQENRPISLGCRRNSGATVTTDDPASIDAAFRALSTATVIVVENRPDLNVDLNQTRDYIFTMADGTSYTFSFAQRCLAVTAAPGFGPVYYWITNVDELWNVNVSSRGGADAFSGGAVGELREDIRRASEAAEGLSEELSVLGVFVEYTIGENSGYLTLDGDTAVDFLRQVCAVSASAETVEAPQGDKITVSVTLSDSSGPILYFTGDAIQQVVGVNYLCDSGSMSLLRDTVLELAANGYNTAVVESGGTE